MYKEILNSILSRFEDFIFPPLCIICDKPRSLHSKWLCEGCLNHLLDNNKNGFVVPDVPRTEHLEIVPVKWCGIILSRVSIRFLTTMIPFRESCVMLSTAGKRNWLIISVPSFPELFRSRFLRSRYRYSHPLHWLRRRSVGTIRLSGWQED